MFSLSCYLKKEAAVNRGNGNVNGNVNGNGDGNDNNNNYSDSNEKSANYFLKVKSHLK
jgi:hypothetical protein